MSAPASRRRRVNRLGQTVVEYALMMACMGAECAVFWKLMTDNMPKVFGKIECMINSTTSCPWP